MFNHAGFGPKGSGGQTNEAEGQEPSKIHWRKPLLFEAWLLNTLPQPCGAKSTAPSLERVPNFEKPSLRGANDSNVTFQDFRLETPILLQASLIQSATSCNFPDCKPSKPVQSNTKVPWPRSGLTHDPYGFETKDYSCGILGGLRVMFSTKEIPVTVTRHRGGPICYPRKDMSLCLCILKVSFSPWFQGKPTLKPFGRG